MGFFVFHIAVASGESHDIFDFLAVPPAAEVRGLWPASLLGHWRSARKIWQEHFHRPGSCWEISSVLSVSMLPASAYPGAELYRKHPPHLLSLAC